ncbi:MAG: hypothetical protein ABIT83_08300 [Massilia sp.]
MKFKCLIALILACVAGTSQAEGNGPNLEVTTIHFYNGITGVLARQATMVDPDACGRSEWYILPDT